MPSDILIIPNRNSTTAAPVMLFSGSQGNTIRLEVLTSGSVAFLGKSGSLFSISDNFSGSLMAVGDISGLPILEVFSDDRVVMGRFNSNALVVTGSNVGIGKSNPNPAARLDVSGSVFITGSLSVSQTSSFFGPVKFANNTWNLSNDNFNRLYFGTSGRTFFGAGGGYEWRSAADTTLAVLSDGGDFSIGKTTANAKLDVNGNVIITGSLSVITSSGTGAIITAPSALANTEAGLFRIADSANTNRKLFFGIDNTVGTHGASYIQSVLTGTTNLPLILNPNAGSVLIGTSTDSSNGRLQLPVTTTSAGGIGFGTETSLYRYQAGGLVIDHTNGTAPAIMWRETGTSTLRIETNSQVGYISTLTANSLILRTNSINALTLDTSQNATLSGNYFYVGGAGNFYVRATGANNGLIRANIFSTDVDGDFRVRNAAGTQNYLTVDSQKAVFSGSVGLGKTPTTKLDVLGNVFITGSLSVTDGVAAPADYKNNLHPFLFITFL